MIFMDERKDIFYLLKNMCKNSLDKLKVEKNFSKRFKDEFLIVHLGGDVKLMFWKKIFLNCGLFSSTGNFNNQNFKIWIKLLSNNNFELYKFNEDCPHLFDKNHKILDKSNNILIYKDTQKLMRELKRVISKDL